MQMVNLKLKKFKNPKDFVQIGFSFAARNWISPRKSEAPNEAPNALEVETVDFNFEKMIL